MKINLSLNQNPVARAHQAARTCYFSGEVTLNPSLEFSEIAKDCLKSKHFTVHQHTYATLEISGVSRFFCSSVLYALPYYQASQQSLRYVKLESILSSPENTAIKPEHLEAYDEAFDLFSQPVADHYTKIWKSKAKTPEGKLDIRRATQELARYCLPIGTKTNLTYTVDLITLAQIVAACEVFGSVFRCNWVEAREFAAKVREEIASEKQDGYTNYLFDLMLQGFTTEQSNPYIKAFKLTVYMPHDVGNIKLASPKAEVQTHNTEKHHYISAKLSSSHAVFCQVQRHRSLKPEFDFTLQLKCVQRAITTGEAELKDWKFEPVFNIYSPVQNTELSEQFLAIVQKLNAGLNKVVFKEVNLISEFESLPLCSEQKLDFYGTISAVSSFASKRLCLRAQNEATRLVLALNTAYAKCEELPEDRMYFKAPCTYNFENDIKPICPEGKRFCGVTLWKNPAKTYENML